MIGIETKSRFFTEKGAPTLVIVSFELGYPDWLKLKDSVLWKLLAGQIDKMQTRRNPRGWK